VGRKRHSGTGKSEKKRKRSQGKRESGDTLGGDDCFCYGERGKGFTAHRKREKGGEGERKREKEGERENGLRRITQIIEIERKQGTGGKRDTGLPQRAKQPVTSEMPNPVTHHRSRREKGRRGERRAQCHATSREPNSLLQTNIKTNHREREKERKRER